MARSSRTRRNTSARLGIAGLALAGLEGQALADGPSMADPLRYSEVFDTIEGSYPDLVTADPKNGFGHVRFRFGSNDNSEPHLPRLLSVNHSKNFDLVPGVTMPALGNPNAPVQQDMRLGSALAVGDFDGDGRADIVVGISNANAPGVAYAGQVVVLYGADLQSSPRRYKKAQFFRQGSNGLADEPHKYDEFGASLAVGDLNCDGVDDLVIGVPGEDLTPTSGVKIDAGAVHVIYSKPLVGLVPETSDFLTQEDLGYGSAKGDEFGRGLAVGEFGLRSCPGLAVGAPGRDDFHADSGVIYEVPTDKAGVDPMGTSLWTRAKIGMQGLPEKGDRFGARLGTRTEPDGESLWTVMPGRTCAADPDAALFHVIMPGVEGLTTTGNGAMCSRHVPSMLEDEAGRLVYKEDRYGRYYQYVPLQTDEHFDIMTLVHGTSGAYTLESELANATKYGSIIDWWQAAYDENAIIIAPAFGTPNFGNNEIGLPDTIVGLDSKGGYRQDRGRDIAPSRWVNVLVDSYAPISPTYDGTMYLFGQSAGAQFVTRYMVQYPDRLLGTVVSSPNTQTHPDPNLAFPAGMGAKQAETLSFLEDDWTTVSSFHFPAGLPQDPQVWSAAYQTPIQLMCGDQEVGHCWKLIHLMAEIEAFEPNHTVELCIRTDGVHSGTQASSWAVNYLFGQNDGPCRDVVTWMIQNPDVGIGG